MDVLLQGTRFKPSAAKEKGLVDELVATQEELVPAAKAWIKANPDSTQNPWDAARLQMPGGTPKSPALAAFLPAFPRAAAQADQGCGLPSREGDPLGRGRGRAGRLRAPRRGSSRGYLTNLVVNQGSKNMIQAFYFDLQANNSGSLRPQGIGARGRPPRSASSAPG
jgi:3-hydroxyacyl-CoA dehydrogenase/enoyl-CoA hydratase/3-hydroxybutyryl-CoA epimerase